MQEGITKYVEADIKLHVLYIYTYTGHTQKNGAGLIVNTITTAPFFCICPVYKGFYQR
jgi:hypothetical protein